MSWPSISQCRWCKGLEKFCSGNEGKVCPHHQKSFSLEINFLSTTNSCAKVVSDCCVPIKCLSSTPHARVVWVTQF